METTAGIAGGWVAGTLPDVGEPATTPRHRGPLHSWAPAGSLATWANHGVSEGQRVCRDWAQHWEARAAASTGFAALVAGVIATLCRLAAGFIAGLQAGYLSHLGLDAFTPASLPLLLK